MAQKPRINALAAFNAGVIAKFPVELAVTDINCKNPHRSTLQEAIGKPASRGTDIEANPSRGIDPKMLQSRLELQTTPANEALVCDNGENIVGSDR